MPLNTVQWGPKFIMHIPVIDEQHKELARITNELIAANEEGIESADKKFRQSVKAAAEYVKVHFRTEEELMQQMGYPDLFAHREEHENFIKVLLTSAKEFESGMKGAANTFTNFLRTWLWEHIAVSDRRFGDFAGKREG